MEQPKKGRSCYNCKAVCCYCPTQERSNPFLPSLGHSTSQESSHLFKTGDYSRYPSPHYLQGAQVNSCNRVIIARGKINKAVPFYSRRKEAVVQPSSMLNSWSHEIHRMHLMEHVGSSHKLLTNYEPNAMRNRLFHESKKKQTNHESQVQIGGSKPYNRRFLTTYQNHFTRKDKKEMRSHVGILSTITRWEHQMEER